VKFWHRLQAFGVTYLLTYLLSASERYWVRRLCQSAGVDNSSDGGATVRQTAGHKSDTLKHASGHSAASSSRKSGA